MPKLTTAYLATLTPRDRQSAIIQEFIRCQNDPVYCIQTYFTVVEPNGAKRVPFKLYPHQLRAINDFEDFRYNISMKSRQMGFTTVSSAYTAWYMATKSGQVTNALANKLKTSRKFLKTVRDFLDDARKNYSWLIADYVHNNNGKDSFGLKTGCVIVAESNNEDACRGDTINLLIIDEVAAIDRANPERMSEIWSSAGITLTRSRGKCIAISTPKGGSGWYFEQYTNALQNGWNVIDAHWAEHPDFSRGMYQFVKDEEHPEGYVKMLNPVWPDIESREDEAKYKTPETYPYVMDGKIRSPWYDYESRKLGVQRTKCELDCSFSGSGGEVIDSERIRELEKIARTYKAINEEEQKGPLRSLKVYKEYNINHGYILSADVATGDGSDFSAFVVIDIQTREIVCTYKENIAPTAYAAIIADVGNRYGDAIVMVEYQGPGLTVLTELKERIQYKNIYHHTLKKQEPTKVQKRKIGFWQGENTRALGGDKLEEIINSGELKILAMDFITELHTWIWDKDGKRRHAPQKHDDLIMATSNAIFYLYFVQQKRENNLNMMKTHFDVVRNGWGRGM